MKAGSTDHCVKLILFSLGRFLEMSRILRNTREFDKVDLHGTSASPLAHI